jgi:hypothetical protein
MHGVTPTRRSAGGDATLRRRWRLVGGIGVVLVTALVLVLVLVRGPADEHTDAPSRVATGPLAWPPPRLVDPIPVQLSSDVTDVHLDDDRDYVLQLPNQPLVTRNGVRVNGGHDVVLIGGEVHLTGTASNRRGLYLRDQTGTVHVEGLRITGAAQEGIDLQQRRGAVVQLENIHVDRVDGSRGTNHADLLQTWSGPRKLRIDGFSGTTSYQGFFLTPNQRFETGPAPEEFDLRNVFIRSTTAAGYALWSEGTWPLRTTDVWVDDARDRHDRYLLWPKGSSGSGGRWEGVHRGTPAKPVVQPDDVGVGYLSPGYRR